MPDVSQLNAKLTTVRMAQSKLRRAQEELAESEANLVEAIINGHDPRMLLRVNYTNLARYIAAYR